MSTTPDTAPTEASGTTGPHRPRRGRWEGSTYVVAQGADLGPACIKCGATDSPHRRRFAVAYTSDEESAALAFLHVILGLFGWLLSRLAVHSRGSVRVALCDRHERLWRRASWLVWVAGLAFVAGIIGGVAAGLSERPVVAAVAFVLGVLGGLGTVWWCQHVRLTVVSADAFRVRLRGVSRQVGPERVVDPFGAASDGR